MPYNRFYVYSLNDNLSTGAAPLESGKAIYLTFHHVRFDTRSFYCGGPTQELRLIRSSHEKIQISSTFPIFGVPQEPNNELTPAKLVLHVVAGRFLFNHLARVCQRDRKEPHPKNVLNVTLNYLMVKLQSFCFEECGVFFHSHYSQVLFEPEW